MATKEARRTFQGKKRPPEHRLAHIAAITIYLVNFPVALGFRIGEIILFLIATGLMIGRRQIPNRALFLIFPSLILATGTWIGTLQGNGTWDGFFQPFHYIFTLSSLGIFFSLLDAKAIIRFLISSAWSIGAMALLALILYFSFPQIAENYNWIHAKRMALWTGVNRLGYIFAVGSTLVVGLIGTGYIKKFQGVLLLFTIIAALTTTMSIGSFLSASIGITVVFISFFINNKSRKNKWSVPAITLLIIFSFPYFISYLDSIGAIPERYSNRVVKLYLYLEKGRPTDEGSYQNRLSDITNALELIAKKPVLGYGGGQQERTGIYPHTLPLLLYLEGGLLSILGLSILLFLYSIIVIRNWRSQFFLQFAPLSTGIFIVFLTGIASHAHMYAIDYHGILVATLYLVTKRRLSHIPHITPNAQSIALIKFKNTSTFILF